MPTSRNSPVCRNCGCSGLLAAAAICILAPAALAQDCPLHIDDRFSVGTIDGGARAMLFHDDDGDGPRPEKLIVGGMFTAVGPLATGGIAAHVDRNWEVIGDGLPTTVRALAQFDPDGDGPGLTRLYAAGLNGRIYEWDGAQWQTIGIATGPVYALETGDLDGEGPLPLSLLIGGQFAAVNGVACTNVARWDGQHWSSVSAGGPNGPVYALACWDRDGDGPLPMALYAGGQFTQAGTVAVTHIAGLAAGTWFRPFFLPLGGSVPEGPAVFDLLVCDVDDDGVSPEALYLCGSFTGAGNGIAAWNGSMVSVGGGVAGIARAMEFVDTDGEGPLPARLLVVGGFTLAGGSVAYCAAAWDGFAWTTLPALEVYLGGEEFMAITKRDMGAEAPVLAVGGVFNIMGGCYSPRAATWRNGTCQSLANGLDDPPRRLFVFDEDGDGAGRPNLFAMGSMTNAGGHRIAGVAKWDGDRWHPVVEGRSSVAYDAAVFDDDGPGGNPPALYVGGWFRFLHESDASHFVGRWDGVSWSPVATPDFSGRLRAVAAFDPDGPGPEPRSLFLAGNAWDFQDPVMYRSASPLADDWQAVPGLFGNQVQRLLAWEPEHDHPLERGLYASGDVNIPMVTNSVARWDGVAWTGVGNGLGGGLSPPSHEAMIVFDPDRDGPLPENLLLGGTTVLAAQEENVAYVPVLIDGEWSRLGDGLGWASTTVRAVTVFDLDGPGPRPPVLLVGGSRIHLVDDTPVASIAVWDGITWSALFDDHRFLLGANVRDMIAFDDDGDGRPSLFVSGFAPPPGAPKSQGIARLTPGEPASVTTQPISVTASLSGTAVFSASASGEGGLAYQWLRNGDPLNDDGRITGATTSTLTVNDVVESDAGMYELHIVCPCGSTTSVPAELRIGCPADFDGNGEREVTDIFTFLAAWFAGEAAANVDGDPGITVSDIFHFLTDWFAGCG